MRIDELTPRSRNINLTVQILSMDDPQVKNNDTSLAEGLVGDDTGTIIMTFWNEEIKRASRGRTVRIRNARVNLVDGYMRLSLGREGEMYPSDTPLENIRQEPNISDVQYKMPRFTDRRGGPGGRGGPPRRR